MLNMFFRRFASIPLTIVLLAASVGMQIWFFNGWLPPFLELSQGLPPLDARFIYTPTDLARLFNNLGAEGRQFYSMMTVLDLLFIAVSATGYAFWLHRLTIAVNPRLGWLRSARYIPIVFAVADFSEDVLIFLHLWLWPNISSTFGWMTTVATICKQLTIVPFLVSLSMLVVLYVATRLARWSIAIGS